MIYLRTGKSDRKGSVVVLVALMLTVLLAMSALAFEGGGLIEARRKCQAAADAAALSAAADLYEKYRANSGTPNSDSRTSATTTASGNSFLNDASSDPGAAGTSKVEIRDNGTSPNTYKGGSNIGTVIPIGYVEVTITRYVPRSFSKIFGTNVLPVTARAVARGKNSVFANGVICLSPDAAPALKTNGTGAINVADGDMIVNSTAGGGAKTSGGATITATSGFDIFVSGPSVDGSGFSPSPILNVAPTPDPLAYLPEPSVPGTNGTMTTTGGKGKKAGDPDVPLVLTMTPGYYANGVSITGTENVIMEPGLYYFNEGFKMTGQGTLSGTGVCLFTAGSGPSQGITLAGNGAMTLTPMTTGVYTGITVFQERSSNSPITITGNGISNVQGCIYAAGAEASIMGNGDASVAGQVIALTAVVGGNGTTNIDFNAPAAPGERIIQLVE